jgi:hypothetical protein
MKITHLLAGSALGTATLAGIAVAQVASNWPQVELNDLEQCRPVIAQAHSLEEAYVRKIAVSECNAPARFYSTESCRTARRWLSKTESQDDLVWYFEGNDRCQGTDYPCFGVKIYNTVRSGEEARRWSKYFLDKSAKPFGITRGMDLWTAAREADTCVSGVWAGKYRTASSPAMPKSEPVQVAAAAAPAAPLAEPPPVDVKAPLVETPAADELALAAAATAAAPAAATAAAATNAATTTAATAVAVTTAATAATVVKDEPAAAEQDLAAAEPVAVATPPAAAVTPPASVAAKATPPVTASTKKAIAIKGDPMQQIAALVAEGKTSEAIALGDKVAAGQPAGDGQLTTCRTRVIAKQDLDRALIACYSTGKPSDPAMLEARGQLHLLAGRHQDAWNDLNAAYSAKESNSTLYLRGLALAGMGKTVDALKDLATAEAGEKGVMAAYESKGYTLANVMSGKPLVDASAMAAPVAAAAAAALVEPTAPAAAVAAPAVAAAPAAAAAAPAVIPAPTAVPAAPAVPAPAAAAAPATEPPPALPAVPEAAIPVAVPAAKPAPEKPAEQGSFAASTGSAVAVPGISLPAVTDCLTPVAPGNGGRGAFKNKCNYPVRYTYCNIKGAESVPQLTCGSDTKYRTETIGANGSAAATLGLSVAYFACRSPTMPEVIYTSNNGLEGYCR